MLRCPNCNSHDLGKIAVDQRYCWHCFIEMTTSNDEKICAVYQIEEDGTRSSLNDLFR
jgi:hypothetical protein